jgi:hypothetical protein
MARLTLFSVCLFLSFLFCTVLGNRNVSDCTCGYYDAAREQLFTESIVIYMNETDHISPIDFVVENFEHKSERSWNAIYRAGASPDNIGFSTEGNVTALQLTIDPSTKEHLVVGAGIRTARRDIQYGSFCASMQSPPQNYGGSSLSMFIEYNYTQAISVNLQNTNTPSTAWVSTLMNHEFPRRDFGLNYSTIEVESKKNGTEVSPWEFTEYCISCKYYCHHAATCPSANMYKGLNNVSIFTLPGTSLDQLRKDAVISLAHPLPYFLDTGQQAMHIRWR